MKFPYRALTFFLGALALTFSVGCSDAPVVTDAGDSVKNLRGFGQAYSAFYQANRRAPMSEQELAPFLQKQGDPKTLTTDAGGQPLKVYWGISPVQGRQGFQEGADPAGGVGVTVIAHESGDGEMVTAFTTSGVVQMTQEELQASLPKQQ